jgi:hypothetical protein
MSAVHMPEKRKKKASGLQISILGPARLFLFVVYFRNSPAILREREKLPNTDNTYVLQDKGTE